MILEDGTKFLTHNSSLLLYNNLFFNTNITNFSNVAERLTEGIIRFVLHTNLFELHECR